MSHSTLVPDPSPLPLHRRGRPGPVMARAFARNEVRPLEMDWVDEIRINLSAAERRNSVTINDEEPRFFDESDRNTWQVDAGGRNYTFTFDTIELIGKHRRQGLVVQQRVPAKRVAELIELIGRGQLAVNQ